MPEVNPGFQELFDNNFRHECVLLPPIRLRGPQVKLKSVDANARATRPGRKNRDPDDIGWGGIRQTRGEQGAMAGSVRISNEDEE
jgi:hypothetical protein